MDREARLRAEIVEVGRLMYEKDLIVGIDGNVSARLTPGRFLITPSGLPKGSLTEDDILVIDDQGAALGPETALSRGLKPTSELPMHLEAYRQRPDVGAVVHAHPPISIALSIANIPMDSGMLPESLLMVGPIVTAPYSLPSSEENAAAIRELVVQHDAIILQRHGSLTVGDSPRQAYLRLEAVEQNARILFMLAQLGGGDPSKAGQPLPAAELDRLLELRVKMGLGPPRNGQPAPAKK